MELLNGLQELNAFAERYLFGMAIGKLPVYFLAYSSLDNLRGERLYWELAPLMLVVPKSLNTVSASPTFPPGPFWLEALQKVFCFSLRKGLFLDSCLSIVSAFWPEGPWL